MKKFLLIAAIFTISSIASFAQSYTDKVHQYIDTYKDIAINEMIRTGVPASITLAQGILESQAGQSELVKQSNNHFGIKCKAEWTGAVVYHDDDKKQECFRSYSTAEESFRDHSDFLKNRPYYTSLFTLDPTDYTAWAKGLKKAGYATESDYAGALIKVIEDNNLEQYTDIALQQMKNNPEENFASNTTEQTNTILVTQNTAEQTNNTNTVSTPENQPQQQFYPDGMFEINHTKVMYVKTGTSLFALASSNNISYAALLEFNDLNKTGVILNKDQLIFFERKQKKGDKDFHIVNGTETIEDIAQKEGVRLENILEYNQMQKGTEPLAGEKIYLRSLAVTSPKTVAGNLK